MPYIEKLEYGGYGHFDGGEWIPANGEKTTNGYSKQAPEGMVGVTLANKDNILKAAINAIEG